MITDKIKSTSSGHEIIFIHPGKIMSQNVIAILPWQSKFRIGLMTGAKNGEHNAAKGAFQNG